MLNYFLFKNMYIVRIFPQGQQQQEAEFVSIRKERSEKTKKRKKNAPHK